MAELNEGCGNKPESEIVYNNQENSSDPSSCSPAGSVFSSPKLLSAGASNNPFAMRSSPSRLSENSENNPSCIIAPSKFGASAAALLAEASSAHADASECNGASVSSKPLLRPSLIGVGVSGGGQNQSSILKPAVLSNPFTKAVDVDYEEVSTGPASSSQQRVDSRLDSKPQASSFQMSSRLNHDASSSVSATDNVTSDATAPAAAGEEGVPETTSSTVTTAATPSSTTHPTSLLSGTSSGLSSRPTLSPGNPFSIPVASTSFVFGQKLHERVANLNHVTPSTSTETFVNGGPPSDNLFTMIAKKEKIETDSTSTGNVPPTNGVAACKTLNDSARELEEARAAKRKYDEVAVITGEEDEQNALQVYGKLFTFDKVQGTWVERGRGTLRLNDKQMDNKSLQSRLVMRTQGCLRVILNTKIWTEMTIDKTSSKSIRLTAVDGEQIRVFLLMASLKDTETLYNALEWRLASLRAHQSRNPEETSSLTEGESSASSPKRRSISEAEELEEVKKKRSE